MELVEINGRKWQKYKGDEGQDVYIAQFMIGEDELLGKYVDNDSYDILVENDADFYLPPEKFSDASELTEKDVAFKFRKNVFTQAEQKGADEGLFDAAIESNNRGLAAGPREETQSGRDWVTTFQNDVLTWFSKSQPAGKDFENGFENMTIDEQLQSIHDNIKRKEKYKEWKNKRKGDDQRGDVWLTTKIEEAGYKDYKNFFSEAIEKMKGMSIEDAAAYATEIKQKWISQTSYATAIWSGIAGFYGRYPRIPYGRATAYVDHNREKFELSYPFARKLEAEFKRMMPNRWAKQNEFAERLDNKFLIGEDTTFTTITVNTTTKDRNARMACHRDAGSLNEGFSNLTVVTKDGKDWKGGYLVAPEVRAAINIRPGDLLLIDNMRVIHGNTPIEAPDSGEDDFLRMSLVYYFREDMDQLGSWEYEAMRKQFVDDRRLNEEHPEWRKYWNGVSPSMWESQEWYDYLEAKMGKEIVEQYHPEAYEVKSSLESFFG